MQFYSSYNCAKTSDLKFFHGHTCIQHSIFQAREREGGRERERERQRQTDRDRQTERNRETDTERDRQSDRQTDRDRESGRHIDRQRTGCTRDDTDEGPGDILAMPTCDSNSAQEAGPTLWDYFSTVRPPPPPHPLPHRTLP